MTRIVGASNDVAEVKRSRLLTEAARVSNLAAHCREGRGFVCTTLPKGLLTVTSGGFMMFLQNNDSLSDFEVENVFMVGDTDATWGEIHIGVPGSAVSDWESGYVKNLQVGVLGAPTQVEALTWDETGTGITGFSSGGIIAGAYMVDGKQEFFFGGGLILRPGGNMAIRAAGSGEFACGVNFVQVPTT